VGYWERVGESDAPFRKLVRERIEEIGDSRSLSREEITFL